MNWNYNADSKIHNVFLFFIHFFLIIFSFFISFQFSFLAYFSFIVISHYFFFSRCSFSFFPSLPSTFRPYIVQSFFIVPFPTPIFLLLYSLLLAAERSSGRQEHKYCFIVTFSKSQIFNFFIYYLRRTFNNIIMSFIINLNSIPFHLKDKHFVKSCNLWQADFTFLFKF